MNNNNFKKGFTLVEISITILIIGIIAAFIIPSLAGTEDSSAIKAAEAVKGYITEYKVNNNTDYENDLVAVNMTDSKMFIFGYSYDEDVLYVLGGSPWLTKAVKNFEDTDDTDDKSALETVTENIIKSALAEDAELSSAQYPDAQGLFTCGSNPILNAKKASDSGFGAKTVKKMYNNTLFLAAKINPDYEKNGYTVAYAEPELVDSSMASAEYTTVFMNGSTEVASFNSKYDQTFVCPDDPTKEGEYFIYWNLKTVNGETSDKAAVALIPGETYEVPNSNVVYEAVFTGSIMPSQEDGVYLVYNAAQLNWVGENVRTDDVKIMRSFSAKDVSITPIGTSAKPYTGSFDGNGQKIIDLKITGDKNTALFAFTDTGAVIKDLTLESPEINGDRFVAALVGKAVGTTINKCSVTQAKITCKNITDETDREHLYVKYTDTSTDPATVYAEGGTYCGGLVGYGKNVKLKNCEVSGEISGGNSGSCIGGVIGAVSGEATLQSCGNTAKVEGIRYVGGVVGKTVALTGESAVNNVEITECYNDGTVVRSATVRPLPTEETDLQYVTEGQYCIAYGGIIGGTATVTTIDSSYNAKAARVVSSTAEGAGDIKASYAGGVVGMADDSTLNIKQSMNYGEVSYRQGCGGILGANIKASLNITGSDNYGKVTASAKRAGGIVGYIKDIGLETGFSVMNEIKITSCETDAKSKVEAQSRVGGIVGDNERKIEVSSCINNGKVTETMEMGAHLDTGCGGIIGYTVGNATVKNCTNNGTVKSGCQGVGGIMGKATSVTVAIPTTIPAETEGATPQPTTQPITAKAKNTKITACVNNGTVRNDSEPPATAVPTETPDPSATPTPTPFTYAGGILGYSDELLTVDYCYNAGHVKGDNNVGGIAGAMATPTLEEGAVVDPTEPTASTLTHSYNVGVVEAKTIAGAIIGTDAWEVTTSANFYLKNCVQPKATLTVITAPSAAGSAEFGQEKTAEKFAAPDTDADGVLALLNADRIAASQEPYFTALEAETEYTYSEAVLSAAEKYSLNLPKAIPVLK